jgi:hypothetical protein
VNGLRQRTHRTAVEQLEARIANLETMFAELAGHYSQFSKAAITQAPEIAADLAMHTRRLDALEGRVDRALALDAQRPKPQTLATRLRWLLTGR